MARLRTHMDWHTQDRPISLSGDRLRQVAIDEGDGCVHPSAHTGADAHDQPRSRPRCLARLRGRERSERPRARRPGAGRWC
jgi:hypothetical protein